ncbi:MAG: Heimdall-CTERM domain-containing surface protein [Promethearchaeota archaeon]
MKTTKNTFLGFSIILGFLLFSSIVSSGLGQVPVIELDKDATYFVPTSLNDDWLYYVNPPGTDFRGSEILYKGISGTHNAEYTYFSNYNQWSYSSVNLERNELVNDNLLTNTTRYGYHPFFNPEPYPRAVRIQSTFNPIYEYSHRTAINLHMGYSFSFMAEAYTTYFGFLDTNEPFLLDIHIYDCDADGGILFPEAFPLEGHTIGYLEKKMTYPFIPRNNSVTPLNFTLWLDQGSLVTLTPHAWEYPDYLPTLDVNRTYSGEIDQGKYMVLEDNEIIYPDNEIFSIRMFNLELEEEKSYELFVDFIGLERTSCTSGYPFIWLAAEHIDIFPNSAFNQNGYRFRAKKNESATLILFSQSWSSGEYTIYYQNIMYEPEVIEAHSLTFNRNIELEYYTYYYFTLDAPHMLAVNYSYYFYFDLYIRGSQLNEWIYVDNQNFFSPEYGNLVGDWVEDIGNNWRYFPAGTYAIRPSWFWSSSEIRFTKIPIFSPSTVSVNKNSIFAFEVPLTRNRINFINISTNEQVLPNQIVNYEYSWVGKYNEMIKDFYYSGNVWIGNRNDSGQWVKWGSNNTLLESFLPTRDYETPILLIRPYLAENSTGHVLSSFIARLTVSTNVPDIQHYTYNYWNAIGAGFFIPKDIISSSTSYTINDDVYAGSEHLYGIPLSLPRFRIYNITASLLGNFSTGSSLGVLNASFDGMNIHGGNLNNLAIFNTLASGYDGTKHWYSVLILTVSTRSYLYLDITRTLNNTSYRNATLKIYIREVTRTPLDIDIPPYIYNSTRLIEEIRKDEMLASQILAPEMKKPTPGFELIFTLGTIVSIAKVFSYKRRKK